MLTRVTPTQSATCNIQVPAHFTDGEHPYEGIEWSKRTACIANPDGTVVFKMEGVEAPADWSQLSVDIAASKYFRKGGVTKLGGSETSVRQLIDRVVNAIGSAGFDQGYFSNEGRKVFEAELTYLLVRQMAAFNSPVWFNVGLKEAYGITGDPAGNWCVGPDAQVAETVDSYTRPQASACFIRTVEDDLMDIAEGIVTEMRLFKYGSGIGANFSNLRARGEKLSGGGESSGVMSFLEVYDRVAGSIKSGGTTRRAAKMVILDADHPDIEKFIDWKMGEEKKAAALINAGYSGGMDGEAIHTVSGQNANNSVGVSDDFMNAVLSDAQWETRYRKSGKIAARLSAKKLMRKIAEAAWACADPGLQFQSTINRWNTVPLNGPIRACNPCQPGWAPVLTPDGIRTLAEIGAGDTIWSGKRWTTVAKKWSTGIKPVYAFKTRAGVFYGTENHRIVQHGKKVEVGAADAIDVACNIEAGEWLKEQLSPDILDPQDVMDGLVFGDGMVHRASANLPPLLCVGQDDQDYFQSKVAGLFVEDRSKLSPFAWSVQTTMTREEVGKTYDRKVPLRFKRAAPDVVCGFLRGLYSANGSIVRTRVTLKASSLDVIEDVQLMLSSLGIRSYYTVNKGKPVEFENGVYECRQSYDLNISTDRAQFAAVIGFIQKDKQARLEAICARPTNTKNTKTTYEIVEREFVSEEEVFDLTVEDDDHTYWTGGVLVSNCSEFQFLDNTACNLASLNLVTFVKDDGAFDTEGFVHACRVFILAQDILVDYASYPTKRITENSNALRPLGLGYANIGGLLMRQGIPYDSEEGRAICGSITALMSGAAWEMSAEIAAERGPFSAFAFNRQPMLNVAREHLAEVDGVQQERLPEGFRHLKSVAQGAWRSAIEKGKDAGYRNAQLTLLAPTGTIGLLMDCDTTGIEPDFALVKLKKLAGGGSTQIVNRSLVHGLKKLGYSGTEIAEVAEFVGKKGTVVGSAVREEHHAVFDCATGKRSISPHGHLGMMAAAQPFLCGSISKTVNLPHAATVDQIEKLYIDAWKMGLKCIAIYRDRSKLAQALSTIEQDREKRDPEPPRATSRKRLPKKRHGFTQEATVGGHKVYLRTGEYEDGTLGELFIDMHKEGATLRSLLNTIAIAVSLGLQHGVPLAEYVDAFTWTRFTPSGPVTGHANVKMATSIIDYIFKVLGVEYLNRIDLAHVHPLKDQPEVSADPQAQPTNGTKPVSGAATPDAEVCGKCGGLTMRSGTCAVCISCGETTGCG